VKLTVDVKERKQNIFKQSRTAKQKLTQKILSGSYTEANPIREDEKIIIL